MKTEIQLYCLNGVGESLRSRTLYGAKLLEVFMELIQIFGALRVSLV